MENEYGPGAIPFTWAWTCPKCKKEHSLEEGRDRAPIMNCMMNFGKPINLINMTCVRCGFQQVMRSADADSKTKEKK